MKTDDLLDAMKTKLNLTSDYALAKALGVGKTTIGNYRTGFSKPSTEQCFKWADILEVDPAAVIATVNAERETEPTKAAFWRMQAGKYAAALGVLTMLNSGSVAAAIGHGYTAAVKITAVCIIRNQG